MCAIDVNHMSWPQSLLGVRCLVRWMSSRKQPFRTADKSHFSFFFATGSRWLSLSTEALSAASWACKHLLRPLAKTTSWKLTFWRIGRPNMRRNAGKPRLPVRKYCGAHMCEHIHTCMSVTTNKNIVCKNITERAECHPPSPQFSVASIAFFTICNTRWVLTALLPPLSPGGGLPKLRYRTLCLAAL